MFYLEACKKCGRHGSVAKKEGDQVCALCKEKKQTEEVKEIEKEDKQ